MRGTYRQTNKALSAPVLMMGAERSLILLSSFFWGWALMGVLPHWPTLVVILAYGLSLYALRFAAKRDPQGVAIFRTNSRFLVQSRFYARRDFAGRLEKKRRIKCVPVNVISRL